MKILAVFLWGWLLMAEANASLSEIRRDFPQQSGLLKATPIVSAPGADASYLVCVYVAQPGTANHLSAVLKWKDENGLKQSRIFFAASGPISGCNPVRNRARTAATIEVTGAYTGIYDLFVTGFGFWSAGAQGQGGITEPIARRITGPFQGTLLTPAATGDYLMAISAQGAWTLGWSDSQGVQTMSGVGSANGYAFPIHAIGGTAITLTGACTGCGLYVYAAHFGAPAAGAGPLTDYELNLLRYADVKWPKFVNVLSNTSSTMYLFAGNMAQIANSGGTVLEFWGDNLFLQILDAGWDGAPGTNGVFGPPIGVVGAGYRAAPFSFNISTAINTGVGMGWGASPEYSAEVDVVQF